MLSAGFVIIAFWICCGTLSGKTFRKKIFERKFFEPYKGVSTVFSKLNRRYPNDHFAAFLKNGIELLFSRF